MKPEVTPPEKRGAFFRFFFAPKTYHITRTLGTISILGFFLYWRDWGEGNVLGDFQRFSRRKFNEMIALTDEERKIIEEKQREESN